LELSVVKFFYLIKSLDGTTNLEEFEVDDELDLLTLVEFLLMVEFVLMAVVLIFEVFLVV
jgi:hypothetical protein